MSAIVLVVTGAGLSLFVIRENRKKAAIMRNLSMDHVVSSVSSKGRVSFERASNVDHLAHCSFSVPTWTHRQY
jgi:hypothetical protein